MKNLTQTFKSPEGWYSLEYPRIWEMEIYENIPAFFDSFSGKGSLQIFCTKIGETIPENMIKNFPYLNGKDLTDKMRIFLHLQNVDIQESDIKVFRRDNTDFIAHEYEVGDRFYMCVLFQKQNILLLAIYNSIGSPEKEEATVIGQIIQSIKIH